MLRLKNTINEHFVLAIVLAFTFLIYFKFLFYPHISWDDPEMVFRNKAVRTFDLDALLNGHFVGNYIPLNMLIHSLAWMLFGKSDLGHHLINILFHLANGILVYQIGMRLLSQKNSSLFVAGVFLLHPLQIESAGWISELKNCTSAFFFFVALLKYLDFRLQKKQSTYLCMTLYFILSCLCKPSSVVFPLVLSFVDYFIEGKHSFRFFLAKWPLYLIAVLFGVINLRTQAADQFINYSHAFPYPQRFTNAGYALGQYINKFILPIRLSVLYPFPEQTSGIFVSGVAILFLLIFIMWLLFIRNKFEVFGLLGMFVCTLIPVLQLIPFGECLYADRYMYVNVALLAMLLVYLLRKSKAFNFMWSLTTLLVLGIITFVRSEEWKSSGTLYEDIIEKYPDSFVALNSLGVEAMMMNDDKGSLQYFNRAIRSSPRNYKSYYNRGLLFLKMNLPEEAIKSFNESLKLFDYNKAYVGRAAAYYLKKDIAKAIQDAEFVLRRDKDQPKAWFVLGNCYNELNKLEEALSAYDKSIAISNDDADLYFKRAIAYGKKQQFDLCLEDLNRCITLNETYFEAYYWRGVAKVNMKQNPCEDLKIAARNGIAPADNIIKKYCP